MSVTILFLYNLCHSRQDRTVKPCICSGITCHI